MTRWKQAWVAIGTIATLAGCVAIPLPSGDVSYSRLNLADTIPAFIDLGHTTRADVLFSLGEPDGVSEHEVRFRYTRTTSHGGVILVMANGGAGGIVDLEKHVLRNLVLLFDEDNRVASATLHEMSCVGPPCPVTDGEDAFAQPGPALAGEILRLRTRHYADAALHGTHIEGTLLVMPDAIRFYRLDADRKSRPVVEIALPAPGRVQLKEHGNLSRLIVTQDGRTDTILLTGKAYESLFKQMGKFPPPNSGASSSLPP